MKNILDIVFNLGILVSISILAGFINIEKRFYKYKILFQGVLFGTAAILGMLNPLVLAPGLIFDGRSVMLSICGFYFGPIAAAIAAVMALTLRIYQGGPGAVMGVSVIVTASMIGVGFHYFYQKKVQHVSVWVLYLMGILVHTVMVLLMFTLPEEFIRSTLRNITLPVMIAYPLATVFVGEILSEFNIHLKRREALQKSEEQLRILSNNLPKGYIYQITVGTDRKERCFTYLSEGVEKLHEISADAIMKDATLLYRQVCEEDIKRLAELEDEAIRNMSNISAEIRFNLPSGKTEWRLLRSSPRQLLDGRILWDGIVIDITEHKQAEERLKKTMDATIDTMSRIIEAKDPYTHGHQHRVCQLAIRIAREMKLPEDKIEGIRIASLIHDIGKIGLPAEILSKPTKLTDIEFNLIKGHSQIGYDILKSIDFSYPVANIVLQHHERLNGSGYPNKLKADKILLEARILGVADVVEAMSSHRPYRPALGVDKALEEISQNRGILYDPEVVDACLKLFREKGFKFK